MVPLSIVLGVASVLAVVEATKVQRVTSRPCLRHGYNDTIYEHTAKDFWTARNSPLSEYQGKVSLLKFRVNTHKQLIIRCPIKTMTISIYYKR